MRRLVLTMGLVACALVHSASAAVIQTNLIYNTAGAAGNYTNASSIPVSSSDLINGLAPSATNYVGCCETSGGTTTPMTNGSTGTGLSDATAVGNSLFDLGGQPGSVQPWYLVYDLGSIKSIGRVVLTTGHQDSRLNQVFEILTSNDGVNFTSLSDATAHTVGVAGVGFNYSPSTGFGGAAQSTILNNASATLAAARYVEFVALDNGNDVFRELDVIAVPEPASCVLLGLGAVGMLVGARRRAS